VEVCAANCVAAWTHFYQAEVRTGGIDGQTERERRLTLKVGEVTDNSFLVMLIPAQFRFQTPDYTMGRM
jgi:hypothetical protein